MKVFFSGSDHQTSKVEFKCKTKRYLRVDFVLCLFWKSRGLFLESLHCQYRFCKGKVKKYLSRMQDQFFLLTTFNIYYSRSHEEANWKRIIVVYCSSISEVKRIFWLRGSKLLQCLVLLTWILTLQTGDPTHASNGRVSLFFQLHDSLFSVIWFDISYCVFYFWFLGSQVFHYFIIKHKKQSWRSFGSKRWFRMGLLYPQKLRKFLNYAKSKHGNPIYDNW